MRVTVYRWFTLVSEVLESCARTMMMNIKACASVFASSMSIERNVYHNKDKSRIVMGVCYYCDYQYCSCSVQPFAAYGFECVFALM